MAFPARIHSTPLHYTSSYVLDEQDWVWSPGRPVNPGMVLYAMADGSFAVWDPARNYWKQRGNHDVQERLSAYVFSPRDIWDGLNNTIPGKGRLCNGLIDDGPAGNGKTAKLLPCCQAR
jgi:hypothetical protein